MSITKRYIKRLKREIAFLGLGTVELGRTWGIDATLPSEKQCEQIINEAVKKGIDVFDTASSYGSSEKRVGQYLQNKSSITLITKVGEHNILNESDQCEIKDRQGIYCKKPAAAYDFSQKAIINDVENSLQNLKMDTLDIVLLHLDDDTGCAVLKDGTAIETLQMLRKRGKLNYIGVSANGAAADKAAQLVEVDVLEVEYNLLNQTNYSAIQSAADRGAGIFVRGVLGTGLLTSTVHNHLHEPDLPYRKQILKLLELLNNDYKQLSSLALAFAYANKNISAAVVGMDNVVYLNENVEMLKNFSDSGLIEDALKILSTFPESNKFTQIMGEYYQEKSSLKVSIN